MSGVRRGIRGWLARRAAPSVRAILSNHDATLVRIQEEAVERASDQAHLSKELARQASEIERLRLAVMTLERRLEDEIEQRNRLGMALLDRIEAARG